MDPRYNFRECTNCRGWWGPIGCMSGIKREKAYPPGGIIPRAHRCFGFMEKVEVWEKGVAVA